MLPDKFHQHCTAAEAAAFRDRLHRAGKRLVFTSGCFDILHAGHVRYLRQARALGDALCVALNSDASTRLLKGPDRPLHCQDDRAEVLLGLESVDAVVVFDEPRTTNLIRTIRPHLFAKGGDYTVDSLNPEELAALRQLGTEIHILPELKGRSTSATLAKMKESGPKKFRLAVLGSGAGTNFANLLAQTTSGALDAEIVLVLSDRQDAPILEKARRAGVSAIYIDPGPNNKKLSPAAQKEIHDRLLAAGVDLVILAGFMRLLKEPVLSTFSRKIINLHPSLLPEFPGLDAPGQALRAKARRTGCTVHFVDATLDGGEILGQKEVPILPDDTPSSLAQRIHEAEYILLPEIIARFVAEAKRASPSRA